MDFEAFERDVRAHGWPVYGAEVWQDGQRLHGFGDTAQHRYPIYSATKTITAIAAGMAQSEGRIALDRCVLDDLPGQVVAAMPSAQRELYRTITLKRLMTMSVAGYPFRPEGDSWLAYSLSCPLESPRQAAFHYSNIPAYLVGVAVACAVDEPLDSYLTRKLFVPLGIDAPPMAYCPEGWFYGASGMSLTVSELSRIGLLLMAGGMYGGQRLLPEAFVQEATSVQQMNREGGYGYFLWKYRDGFSINGKWGQKCYVLPARGLVITHLAHMEDGSAAIRDSMERHILGA